MEDESDGDIPCEHGTEDIDNHLEDESDNDVSLHHGTQDNHHVEESDNDVPGHQTAMNIHVYRFKSAHGLYIIIVCIIIIMYTFQYGGILDVLYS